MMPITTATNERSRRVEALLARAAELLAVNQHDGSLLLLKPATPAADSHALDVAKLLEDLHIYQVELEVQNEELRRAQQETEFARNRYKTLFGQMPLPAMVLDSKGMIEHSNESADALLGHRKADYPLDNRLFRKLQPPGITQLYGTLRGLIEGEMQVVKDISLRAQGEPSQVFDVHLIKLSQSYHLDHRILVLMVDRTAEVAREQDQHFYTLLLNSSEDLVYATDLQGRMLMANQAFLQLVGRTQPEVIGHPLEDLFSPRDAVLHHNIDQRVLQSNEPQSIDEKIYRASMAEPLDFLTRKFPLHDLQGHVIGVGAISTDVTDIRDQARQAQLSESVFLAASEAIFVTDAQTHIIRVNPAFTKMTGFSESSVFGYPASILKSGRQDAVHYEAMWHAIRTQGHWAGEMNDRAADGRVFTVWNSINAIRDAQGHVIFYVAVQTDLTPLRDAQSKIQLLASYDSLTGLPNRVLFNDRIKQLLAHAQRHGGSFALLFTDLDHFKEVNDNLGHHVGDELLQVIAQRLKDALRAEDTVARMGGDEFVVLLPSADAKSAMATAKKLLAILGTPVMLAGQTSYQPMASVGLVVYPQDGTTADLLLRNADTAMYEAKSAGRNQVALYTQKMGEVSTLAFSIQTDLSAGIDREELRLFFQPKIHLCTGEVIGAEALVRWERPGHGLTYPAVFIEVAERSGLVVAVDQWVMRTAVAQIAQWQQAGLWRENMRMAVNLSARDLKRAALTQEIRDLLIQHAVPAACIELEITEGVLLEHTPDVVERLNELKRMGIFLAIDDFGTGYSSLSYLRNLPIGVIKIDQSFVRDMMAVDDDRVLVATIIAMGHNLGRELVAEGVETDAQYQRLLEMGCEIGQGYLFGRPVPAQAFAQAHLHPKTPPPGVQKCAP